MSACKPTGDRTILSVNALFHSAILFTFLSAFYMFYGSKLETQATNEKFAKLTSVNLKEILEKANDETDGELKIGMEILDPVWDILERDYRGADPTVTTYNSWLFRTSTMLSAFMLVSLVMILIVLSFSCGQCTAGFFWDIIKENVVIFTIVGGVEYLFFKNVATKMIPAPPSLMVDEVVSGIRDGIF